MELFRLKPLWGIPLLLTGCATVGNGEPLPLSPATEWVANSPDWRLEAEQVFEDATDFVRVQGATRSDGSWGVVMDIDETVLNNVAYQIGLDRSGESYSPQSWYLWTQREEATLVPGAANFIDTVNDLGGHIAFVTNRSDREQLATENNLAELGIQRGEDFRVLLTRASPNGESDKQSRFELVEKTLAVQGYSGVQIIAYVGDNQGDKPKSGDEWKFFCIDQGGMYGDPCALKPGPGR